MELLCPRDRLPLTSTSPHRLTCPAGHSYPVHDGIPVFILEEVEHTHPSALRALDPVEVVRDLARDDGATPPLDDLHPYVRDVLVGTCGNLYAPIAGTIDHYPIPKLPLPEARRGDSFLEIGSNWGRWSIAAAKFGYAVTAVDTNLGALVIARRVFRQFGLNANFVCADARHLPFADNSFDVVFSYSVLMYQDKKNACAAIAEGARVAADLSVVQMANKYGLRNVYHRLRRRGSADDPLRVRYWGPRELLAIFGRLAGPSSLVIDGVIGRSIEESEIEALRPGDRVLVRLSMGLRRFGFLRWVADSLYVFSRPGR